jgi:formiminoglutamase
MLYSGQIIDKFLKRFIVAIFTNNESTELTNLWNNRGSERLVVENHPVDKQNLNSSHFILTATSDWGVIRNRGRRGAGFGPAAIINQLKILARQKMDTAISVMNVVDIDETESFTQAQLREEKNIATILKNYLGQKIIHLGGGHDHIYPLLMALDKQTTKKIVILNLDAHLDTRVDPIFHSGTPFRQFDNQTKKPFLLVQMGIHQFANPKSNYTALKNGEMKIVSKEEMEGDIKKVLEASIPEVIKNPEGHIVVLSLDADAICASDMEAVSAPNHAGIKLEACREVILKLRELKCDASFFGIYEYNPLYDNINNKGARTLTYLINNYLF